MHIEFLKAPEFKKDGKKKRKRRKKQHGIVGTVVKTLVAPATWPEMHNHHRKYPNKTHTACQPERADSSHLASINS